MHAWAACPRGSLCTLRFAPVSDALMLESFSKFESGIPASAPATWNGPARLFLFQYGIHPLTKVPVPGYLLEMSDGRRVLVDTGFPARNAGPAREIHWFRVTPEDHVTCRLNSIGLRPEDIDFVICSHFDPDHCGANDLFSHATLFVQREHYEAARHGTEWRFELYRSHWDHPSLQYTLVDGDEEVLPGISLIKTSGHVPGHQSVMVRLQSSRKILLAIDAISRAGALEPGSRAVHPFDMDAQGTRQSIAKLRSIIHEEGIKDIIYGHDALQWPTLLKAPVAHV
jgi:N-acyl homoserine lactone hydrolase